MMIVIVMMMLGGLANLVCWPFAEVSLFVYYRYLENSSSGGGGGYL